MSNPFSAKKPEPEPYPGAAAENGPEEDRRVRTDAGSCPKSEPTAAAPLSESEHPGEAGAMSGEILPALGMDETSCRSCRYLDFKEESRTAAEGGECRRHAPVPGAEQAASWPRVTWEGWCGEWESGVSDEDMVKMARAIADEEGEGAARGFVKNTSTNPEG